MDQQVLVAYATKYGATKEIAERIGEVLNQAGVSAEVLAVDCVSSLIPYKAVVLGSAVHMGKWRKEAAKFLQANEEMLGERQVWLFSSGPTGKGDPISLVEGWRFPLGLQPLADRIRPIDITVFHGSVDMKKLSFLEKWLLKNVKADFGDFRDWKAITSWATTIATHLRTLQEPH